VFDSKSKTSRYIAIERQRGDPLSVQSSENSNIDSVPAGMLSSSTSSVSSFSSLSDSLATRIADDQIGPIATSSGKKDKNDQLIFELNFDEPFYLYELALLAVVVHVQNTSYLLMTNNCYYYAGTIMKVLEEKYNIVNTVDGAGAGKWCGLTIYSGKKEGNSSLLEKFRENIKKFEALEALSGDVSARNEDLKAENAQLREQLAKMKK